MKEENIGEHIDTTTYCESCGEPILAEDQDFNGMCPECYDTPPADLNK